MSAKTELFKASIDIKNKSESEIAKIKLDKERLEREATRKIEYFKKI